jgi:hypothetical protein
MNEQEIKEYISKTVLPQEDKSNENILREIIFSCADVDWSKVEGVIKKEHPEINNEQEMWYIYIVKTDNGNRIGIDEYYDNEINGEYLEKGFISDDEADNRAKEISKKLGIKLFNAFKDNAIY